MKVNKKVKTVAKSESASSIYQPLDLSDLDNLNSAVLKWAADFTKDSDAVSAKVSDVIGKINSIKKTWPTKKKVSVSESPVATHEVKVKKKAKPDYLF